MQSDAEARRRVFEGGKGETPRGAVVVHDHPAPGVTATLPPRPTSVWAVQPLLGTRFHGEETRPGDRIQQTLCFLTGRRERRVTSAEFPRSGPLSIFTPLHGATLMSPSVAWSSSPPLT